MLANMLEHAAAFTCALMRAALFVALAAAVAFAQQRGARNPVEQFPINEEVESPVAEHIERGNRLMREGRIDEAVSEYKTAQAKAKRPLATVHLNLGAAYLEKGDYKSAADAYRQAAALRPNDPRPQRYLADALLAMGEHREAESHYRKSLELTAGRADPMLYHFLGLALYGQKRTDEAVAAYKTAIEMSGGDYGEARYNLGVALMSRGELEAAEREFRLAIEQEKRDWPEAHYNLALVLEKQNRTREAADEYEIYLRLSPNAQDAATLRRHIERLRQQL